MDRAAVRVSNPLRGWLAVLLLMFGDLAALAVALAFSVVLRFDHMPLDRVFYLHLSKHLPSLPLALLCYVAIFRQFNLYRYAWRFAGLGTLVAVTCANTVGLAALFVIQLAWEGSSLPLSVMVIFWMMSIALVGGVRILLRLASLGRNCGGLVISLHRDVRRKRIVILGGGVNGARMIELLREDEREPYKVIGILDDHCGPGIYIHDVRVLGPLNCLYRLLEENAVDEALIALPETPGWAIREYVIACRKRKIAVKVIPGIREVMSGKKPTHIGEFSIEDLLRRPPVCTDMEEVACCLRGKRVLVTGAGGSIGSELCRQIVGFEPSKLVLLGHGENSIHDIYRDLSVRAPSAANFVSVAIASVANSARIDQVFSQHRPEIVFHAAAHKHVPIMEANLLEAVQNNVVGTYNVAESCGRYGVTRMVLISTDKAVYPTSVMGATKRVCEEILRAMGQAFPRTSYSAVRFGNVLGSRGSVVPMFHEQIKQGGPVIVTHEAMTRYFMLIPEAVQLVLQASAVGRSGELYVLDMGEPIRIVDLAKDMIRLCGFEPDIDIPVEFAGVRPGEKLHESLIESEEMLTPAPCRGLFMVDRPEYYEGREILDRLQELQDHLLRGDHNRVRESLFAMIPCYTAEALIRGSENTELIESTKPQPPSPDRVTAHES